MGSPMFFSWYMIYLNWLFLVLKLISLFICLWMDTIDDLILYLGSEEESVF